LQKENPNAINLALGVPMDDGTPKCIVEAKMNAVKESAQPG